VTGKVMVIVPPIAAFVAAGFEHSIANMYFLPIGWMIQQFAGPEFWSAIGSAPSAYAGITIPAVVMNLIPVTIGNVIGGGFFVGAVYWFVYLRNR
jgi:formate transporter